MEKTLEKFTSIIFMDSTYDLSSSKFIVTLLAATDSHGLSHIVGIGILVNETKETLEFMMNAFKNHNKKNS